MSQFIFQAQPKKKSEEILNKWTTTKPKGAARIAATLSFCRRPFVKDFLGFLLGLSLKNKLAHNKCPERGLQNPLWLPLIMAYDNIQPSGP